MKIEITRMTAESARDVAELEAKCFNDPWPYDSFINTLSNEHAAYFTCYFGSEFVGYIGMYNLIDEVSIINVAVDPKFRGKGYGTLLIEAAEDYARRQHGCSAVTLEVRESNLPARKLYEKTGYTPYGIQKKYYTNPSEDAVLYRKTVK